MMLISIYRLLSHQKSAICPTKDYSYPRSVSQQPAGMGLNSKIFLEWKKLSFSYLLLLLKRCLVLELHTNDNMDTMKCFRNFLEPDTRNRELHLMFGAKGKLQLKLQVNTSFKGQILLYQSIKITLVVKLMFMGHG